MIVGVALAMLLQVGPPDPPRPPQAPAPPPVTCVMQDNVVNEMAIQTCMPGLRRLPFGASRDPEPQRDGTWIHHLNYDSEKGNAFETTICGIDLIDFDFTSATGAVFNTSRSVYADEYCTTKGFTVPKGNVTLTVRTRTKSPKLVIRSSVITPPLATLLQPPAIVVIPFPVILFPPPPPPPPPVPATAPPPPPF